MSICKLLSVIWNIIKSDILQMIFIMLYIYKSMQENQNILLNTL